GPRAVAPRGWGWGWGWGWSSGGAAVRRLRPHEVKAVAPGVQHLTVTGVPGRLLDAGEHPPLQGYVTGCRDAAHGVQQHAGVPARQRVPGKLPLQVLVVGAGTTVESEEELEFRAVVAGGQRLPALRIDDLIAAERLVDEGQRNLPVTLGEATQVQLPESAFRRGEQNLPRDRCLQRGILQGAGARQVEEIAAHLPQHLAQRTAVVTHGER